jgi:hypothetical protein
MVHACAVPGCNGLALGRKYCNRCIEEIDALRAMAQAKDERDAARVEARQAAKAEGRRLLARIAKAAAEWQWVPELVFIAGVIGYLGLQWALAFLEWQ